MRLWKQQGLRPRPPPKLRPSPFPKPGPSHTSRAQKCCDPAAAKLVNRLHEPSKFLFSGDLTPCQGPAVPRE